MIDQLLTLARIESTAAGGVMAPVRIDSLTASVVHDLAPLLGERRLKVDLDLQPCEIRGMEFGVAALMRNLIDNAARYSPADGQVHIATGIAEGEAYAAIEDSGPGIPPEERERVFVRFYRIAGNSNDGCGVGLSIVRCVAEAHGARVTLSDSRFGGLRATVHFPRRASA
jgi:signal transduction histidine kinase